MAFPKPSDIQSDYLVYLKSVKPSLNTLDANSDFVIRGKAITGVASGIYGDQAKSYRNRFISTAEIEGLLLQGQDFNIVQQPATAAASPAVAVPGTNGTVINPGDLTFLYIPTNVLYTNTTGGTVASGVVTVAVGCTITGQVGNILAGDTLQIVSPPSGIGGTATLTEAMSDGADIESTDSYRARILSRVQNPPAGGNQTDYPNFAFLADPSVRSAIPRRFGRGLGTVDVYITTGTTDIDSAVTAGIAVVRIPSSGVLATVQAYYDSHVPFTDCPRVYAPTLAEIPVSVNVVLAQGLTLSSVPASAQYNPLGLTCLQLIQREVSRVIYKLPVGGRVLPGSTTGVVAASDIEEGLDVWLSAVPDPITGLYTSYLPILADRQVLPLNGSTYNYPLTAQQLADPGTITVNLGV